MARLAGTFWAPAARRKFNYLGNRIAAQLREELTAVMPVPADRAHPHASRGVVRRTAVALIAILALAMGSIVAARSGEPAKTAETNWLSYGNDWTEQHYSPLSQITPATIKDLGVAWFLELPRSARGLQGTPLAVDGVLYFTTSMSVVYAVDAASGRLLWSYDPEPWKENPRGLRMTKGVNRGAAYADGAVFVGTLDGRLVSLNARSGKPNWAVNTVEPWDTRKQITSAPRVFNDKVIIGNAGADFGTRGYVTAYEIKTGRQVWRFYTVPGDPSKGFENEAMAMAAKTWTGEWWKWGGGGTVWGGITFDKELNRVYIGVGNASNYNPAQRSPAGGDNLFLSSIVALEADSGKYVWHYQTNPREAWDWKATAEMVLADLTIDGKQRKVLMQAPSNGFFYVIDRATGKVISAEKLSKATWAERIDLSTGRPVELPSIRYENGPITLWPSPYGVHNWQAMAFSPRTGLMYVGIVKQSATYSATAQDIAEAKDLVVGRDRYWFPIGATYEYTKIDPDDNTGSLLAWDPISQSARWQIRLPGMINGGTLATAGGLVFIGTGDGYLRAYHGEAGAELWKVLAGPGISAAPISYSVQGVQYVSVLAGYSGSQDHGWRFGKHSARIVTFKLGGKAGLPPLAPDFSVKPLDNDPNLAIDAAAAARGARLWSHSCTICHGAAARSVSLTGPDLRESGAAHNYAALRGILKDGLLVQGGMPQFDERTDEEIRDLLMYIIQVSREERSKQAQKQQGQVH